MEGDPQAVHGRAELGALLRRRRGDLQPSEVAAALGLKVPVTLERWEAGTHRIQPSRRDAVANFVGISRARVDFLVDGIPENLAELAENLDERRPRLVSVPAGPTGSAPPSHTRTLDREWYAQLLAAGLEDGRAQNQFWASTARLVGHVLGFIDPSVP